MLVNASLLPVMSISRTPVIRADGSVIETPGYDVATRIIYAPDASFPPVPVNPTQEDAAQALARLRHPFRAFPFFTETDRDGPAFRERAAGRRGRPRIGHAPLLVRR